MAASRLDPLLGAIVGAGSDSHASAGALKRQPNRSSNRHLTRMHHDASVNGQLAVHAPEPHKEARLRLVLHDGDSDGVTQDNPRPFPECLGPQHGPHADELSFQNCADPSSEGALRSHRLKSEAARGHPGMRCWNTPPSSARGGWGARSAKSQRATQLLKCLSLASELGCDATPSEGSEIDS